MNRETSESSSDGKFKSLLNSRQIFRQMIDHAKDGIIVDDEDGRLVYANAAFLNMFGFPADTDIRHIKLEDYIHSDDQKMLIDRHRRRVRGEDVPCFFEYRGRTCSGDPINVEVNVTPVIVNGEIIGTNSVVRDVSERKKIQSRLFQSESMATIGRLSAGIAHELKNPLTAIMGFSELISAKLETSEIRLMADSVRESAGRIEKIIDQLRLFTERNHQYNFVPLDLTQLVDNSLILLSAELKSSGIDIIRSFKSGSTEVLGDRFYLESVIHNLLVNAIDAFQAIADSRKRKITIEIEKSGKLVALRIRDNACGMNEYTLKRIFDPFFTTKDVGHGTGLGLSVCNEVVKNHKGQIQIESEIGIGTVFSVLLPSSPENALAEPAPKPTSLTNITHSVLCVDDDRAICLLLKKILETDYNVTVVDDPRAAVYMISTQRFDLIITDLKMPKLSGLDIIRQIKEHQPETPVAVATACNEGDDIVKEAMSLGAYALISKPFANQKELRGAVHQIIVDHRNCLFS